MNSKQVAVLLQRPLAKVLLNLSFFIPFFQICAIVHTFKGLSVQLTACMHCHCKKKKQLKN
jgi:hypothetical protein